MTRWLYGVGLLLFLAGVITGWSAWTVGGTPARGLVGFVMCAVGTLLVGIIGARTETRK
jgi:hypothetical protein